MQKIIIKILFLFAVLILFPFTSYSYIVPRADQVNVTLNVSIIENEENGMYEYNYKIINNKESVQELERFFVEYDGVNPEVINPNNWRNTLSRTIKTYEDQPDMIEESRTPNKKLRVTWYARFNYFLKSNNIQEGFILKTNGLPAIVNFYALGYSSKDQIEFTEEDSMYINSFNGKTLGPIDPPDPFDKQQFADIIISYVTEAGILGWINDPAVVTNIKSNLKASIKDSLDTILADLETQHGTSVNDDAYFLLKFNVMYLKDRL
jgi:hypothetical protein